MRENHKQGCPMICTAWGASIPPYCNCDDNFSNHPGFSTPGGIPREDCTVCGREGGHIKSMQKKSNLGKSKELEQHICAMNDGEQSCKCFIKGQSAECQAWMKGERCTSCGKVKSSDSSDWCDKCLREN